MYMVVVHPPDEVVAPLEDYRRRHDPAFHRIGAHLRLIGPFEPADVTCLDAFDTLDVGPPIDVVLGPPESSGEALVLPPRSGRDALERLRGLLENALRGREPYAPAPGPAVLVGRFGIEAERELVIRALAAAPPLPAFRVTSLSLVLQDERGLWHEVRERTLAAVAPRREAG